MNAKDEQRLTWNVTRATNESKAIDFIFEAEVNSISIQKRNLTEESMENKRLLYSAKVDTLPKKKSAATFN